MPGGHYCPVCDTELGWTDDEPDVGIVGGWWCPSCDEPVESDPPSWDPEMETAAEVSPSGRPAIARSLG